MPGVLDPFSEGAVSPLGSLGALLLECGRLLSSHLLCMTTRPVFGYRTEARSHAEVWKRSTGTLPETARVPAPWITHSGAPTSVSFLYCLPPSVASLNLLPEVRSAALSLFEVLGIPWHCGVGKGPGNHLLSSQVQCVNALTQMVSDPSRLQLAFGAYVDVAEVLEIEPGRFLTFEYIGPEDFFSESPGVPRVRGSRSTSADAAFLYRTSAGVVELALVEWKYTEEYQRPRLVEPRDATRIRRYEAALFSPGSPVRSDLLPTLDLLVEPFYQLLRQQLLAAELESRHVLGAERVRVLHVLPPGNDGYQASLTRPSHLELGTTVDEVWGRLLRAPDRFSHVDPGVFLDPRVTSDEYVLRYAHVLL